MARQNVLEHRAEPFFALDHSRFGDGRRLSPERLRIPRPSGLAQQPASNPGFGQPRFSKMKILVPPSSACLCCRGPPFLRAPPPLAPLPSLARHRLARAALRTASATPWPDGQPPARGTARHSRGFVRLHVKFTQNSRFGIFSRRRRALTPSANTGHSSSIRECPVPRTLAPSEGPTGPRAGPGSDRNALRLCPLGR